MNAIVLSLTAAWVLSGGSPHGPCASDDDCGFYKLAAACYPATSTYLPVAERKPGTCRCDTAASTCVYPFTGEVPCKSWRDCSAVKDGEGMRRPVPSKLVPRFKNRKVRACKDAEWDSICNAAGRCEIVAWGC